MRQDVISSLVRIWRRTGEVPASVVGTGFAVTSRAAFTCAHVIANALGLPDDAEKPALPVWVDLPSRAPGQLLEASITLWHPRNAHAEGVYDIAVLELNEALLQPVALATPETLEGQPCRIFGFPAGAPDGAQAAGTLDGALASGWVKLRGDTSAREFTKPGYSGGPVFTESRVIGMLSEGSLDARVSTAVMIPTPVLLSAWPELHLLNRTCPYKGLSSFQEEDARFFKGRNGMVARLKDKIAQAPYLTVLAGASGSGKSSVVHGGLIPQLAEAPEPWLVASFTPGEAPLAAATRALAPLHPARTELESDLQEGQLTLSDAVISIMSASGTKLLLVVDQYEEVFTQTSAKEAHKDLLEALLGLLNHPQLAGRVSVLVAVRTDFLDEVMAHPALLRLQEAHGIITYLGPVEDLTEVIEAPLKEHGLITLEAGLSERILEDVSRQANPLPLLEFTLTELWRRQQGGRMTHAVYDELGGAAKALANHAQALLARLAPHEQQGVQDVLIQLVQPGEDGRATRRLASLREFNEAQRNLITALASAHLVVTGRHHEDAESVELIHEALIEHWPLLGTWLRENWSFRLWQEGLRRDLQLWQAASESSDDLLRGAKLSAAEAYLETHGQKLSPSERRFIERSLEEREARQRRVLEQERKQVMLQRRVNRVLTGSLVIVLFLAGGLAWRWTESLQARDEAAKQAETAQRLNVQLGTANEDLASALQVSESEARRALANQLSAQALLASQDPEALLGDPALAPLLALEAFHLDSSVQSRSALMRVLQNPPPVRSHALPAVALSPDGQLLAVADRNRVVGFWHADTLEPLGEAMQAEQQIDRLAFSPDGSLLASAHLDRSLQLWDLSTFTPFTEPLILHDYPIWHLVFSPDSRLLAVRTADGSVLAWDLEQQEVVARVSPPSLQARNGETVTDAGIPVLWNAGDTPRHSQAALGHEAWTRSLAFSPDGSTLVWAEQDGSLALWDLSSAEVEAVPFHFPVRSLAFSARGETLVLGGHEGQVSFLALPTQALSTPVQIGSAAITHLVFSPDGEALAVSNADGSHFLLELTSHSSRLLLQGVPVVPQLVFRPDGSLQLLQEQDNALVLLASRGVPSAVRPLERRVLIAGETSRQVGLWDVSERVTLGTTLRGTTGTMVDNLYFSPDGSRLAARTGERLIIWDALTGEHLGEIRGHFNRLITAAFSPDGQIIVTGGYDGRIAFWDSSTFASLGSIGTPIGVIDDLVFSPDGSALFASGSGAQVYRFDPATRRITGSPSRELDLPGDNYIMSLVVSPDGRHLAFSYDHFGVVYVFTTDSLEHIATLPSPFSGRNRVLRMAFSSDSELLAVLQSGQLFLWDFKRGERLGEPLATDVANFAMEPGSTTIAACRAGGYLTLWDYGSGQTVNERIRAAETGCGGVTYSPDASLLAIGNRTGDTKLWQVNSTTLLGSACARAKRNLSLSEWQRLIGSRPYNKTCEAYPADPAAIVMLLDEAERDPVEAAARLEQAARWASEQDPDLHARACQLGVTAKLALEGCAPPQVAEGSPQ